MRVLDSKRPQDEAAIAAAPTLAEFLGPAAAEHFDTVRSGLDALGIPYRVEPRLVRGLDYYLRTTFEFAGGTLDGAQNALGGGGRYDGLVEALGGPPTPGVGFALGVDRTLLACDDEGVFGPPSPAVDVFVVDTTGGAEALAITDEVRARRPLGRPRLRPAQHEGADEGGRPQRRPRRRDRRATTSGSPARSCCAPCATVATRSSSPALTSSPSWKHSCP